jgi:hypothetical protein
MANVKVKEIAGIDRAFAKENGKDKTMTALVAEKGLSFAEANKYWDSYLKGTGGKKGWAADLYRILAEGKMTEEELIEWVDGTESNNVKNHFGHYNAIRELANKIWDAK